MLGRKCVVALGLLLALYVPALAEPETDYLAVLMDGKKVGYLISTRTVEGDRVTTSQQTSLTMLRLGVPVTIESTQTSVETIAGKPLRFESTQNLGSVAMKVTGDVNDNGAVSITTSSMGTQQKSTMQWPEGTLISEGLRLLSLEKGLKPGVEYSASIFSVELMMVMTAQVSIKDKKEVDLLGRVVKLTEMIVTLSAPSTGQIVTTSYVDDDMRMLKSITPMAGMVIEMVECPREFALGKNDVVELIDKMFVKSPEAIEDVHAAAAITYTLDPGKIADFAIPSTDNQKVTRQPDGKILLEIRPVQAPADDTLPYKGSDPELLAAMKPTPYLQSDHQQIVSLVRKAVGETKDAAEAARRIESFVGRYIDGRTLSVGYASAAEVAESRQGDCTEFAVLTAAMCRAVGIPSKVVVGVAYVDDFGGLRGFGGHAWTHAYVGGKWIGLDAAFKGGGRGGYDAGHITLAIGNGEPGDFLNMATSLGQFQIEKIRVERAN